MQKVPQTEPGYGAVASAMAKNEAWAFEKIYRENYPAVESYVLKNSGDRDDAKDLFQESVIVVWQKIRSGNFMDQNENAIGALIFQIVRFKWLDKLKSAQHRNTVTMENMHIVQAEQEADTHSLQKDIEASGETRKVSEQVALLGEKCRKLLQAFYFEKLSMKEMGEKYGYEADSVRTLKYRCMKKLRQLYQKQNDK